MSDALEVQQAKELLAIRRLVERQADNATLWFPVGPVGSQTEQLQLALRRLHGLIEGEDTQWLKEWP